MDMELWLAELEYTRYVKELHDRVEIGFLPSWQDLSQLERDCRVEGLKAALEAAADIRAARA